jgi:hypothetical protein
LDGRRSRDGTQDGRTTIVMEEELKGGRRGACRVVF